MRIFALISLILASSLSGCIVADDILPEKRGEPGGLALACLQDDKFKRKFRITLSV